jgi:hypothetical protein
MSVKTANVAGRRQLKFNSLDDILADAERCASENYRPLGNWSAAQIFEHLARVMNGTIDGLPFTVPWLARMILPLFKRRFINGPISPGFNLPKSGEPLVAESTVTTEQALNHLRQAVARLKQTDQRAPSPVFGVMSLDDSDRLQMTHAEMHLSFLVPSQS